MTDSGGTKIHVYTYDSIYQVTGVDYPPELSYLATDSTFNYDAAGNRTSVIDGGGTCTYTANNLNEYTAAGTTSYQYDDSGNMTHDGTYTYDYDPENRLIRVTKSGSPPTPTLGQALDSGLTYTTGGADVWTVTYGESYQGAYSARSGWIGDLEESYLQTEVTGPGTVSFWWKVSSEEGCDYLEFWVDGVRQSGRISGSVGWTQASYPVSGAGTHTLQWRYAKDGSTATGSDCGWVDAVQWSGSCPPAPEPDPAAWLTLAYKYDAAGRRVQKKYDSSVITKYVYDGDHCIAEYDSSNVLRRKYIYGPGVDEPISMIESAGSYAGTYYYHFDGLGNVVGLTNASGNTVEVYEYDVYGRLGASDASHPNRLLFTGREYDKETGLYYYRARYYNPQIGRFLQTDPAGYGDGMNWYIYCRNSPTFLLDPSGCITIPIIPTPFIPPGWSQPKKKTPHEKTISWGAPTAGQLCRQALWGNGGDLHYTDSAACWKWAMEDTTFKGSLMADISNFGLGFWRYARLNCYDPETNTFDLSSWDYKYALKGDYTTPAAPEGEKVHFRDDAPKGSANFWFHNVQVSMSYTMSITSDGWSMTADFKIIDYADLHGSKYPQFDGVLDSLFYYTPYNVDVLLGSHTIEYRHKADNTGGLYIDGTKWP
ncbi:MAG: RHS repeat-associated core domain-containing protein [Planctomycetes bacterium]|nr:RHS repeat-associated core domain-containing protein [Planctomycetota bacterium]